MKFIRMAFFCVLSVMVVKDVGAMQGSFEADPVCGEGESVEQYYLDVSVLRIYKIACADGLQAEELIAHVVNDAWRDLLVHSPQGDDRAANERKLAFFYGKFKPLDNLYSCLGIGSSPDPLLIEILERLEKKMEDVCDTLPRMKMRQGEQAILKSRASFEERFCKQIQSWKARRAKAVAKARGIID